MTVALKLTAPDQAAGQLASNTERALWAAHVRAAELVDTEPGPVSRNILSAVNQRWRQAFLDLPS